MKFGTDGEYWYYDIEEIMDGMQHSVFQNFSNLRFPSNSYEPRTDRARYRERQQRPFGRREDGHAWRDDQGNWRYPRGRDEIQKSRFQCMIPIDRLTALLRE